MGDDLVVFWVVVGEDVIIQGLASETEDSINGPSLSRTEP